MIEWAWDMRTIAWANTRGHWRALQGRKRREKEQTRAAWIAAGSPIPAVPCRVEFWRITANPMDSDNALSAFKYVRDELAECWGYPSDRIEGVRWDPDVKHEKTKRGTHRVRVRIYNGT